MESSMRSYNYISIFRNRDIIIETIKNSKYIIIGISSIKTFDGKLCSKNDFNNNLDYINNFLNKINNEIKIIIISHFNDNSIEIRNQLDSYIYNYRYNNNIYKIFPTKDFIEKYNEFYILQDINHYNILGYHIYFHFICEYIKKIKI
jgi:hypothetical protein